jgi:hypothetical protein
MNRRVGFALFIDAGSIPAEPTIGHWSRIAPVMNRRVGFALFIDTGTLMQIEFLVETVVL